MSVVTVHRALRDALGRFATGVAVVTTTHHGRYVGVTVNSFTSLSLEPPLVLWCLNVNSRSRTAFTGAPHFAVNVLAADQRELAIRFASRYLSAAERFRDTALRPSRHGLPLLAGAVATLVCRRHRIVPGGDHVVLIGEVLDHDRRPGPALLFHDGEYRAS